MKRSFAAFQHTDVKPARSGAHTSSPRAAAQRLRAQYDTPPTSCPSPSTDFQHLQYPRSLDDTEAGALRTSREHEAAGETTQFPILRRSQSLPTLRELRKLHPYQPLTSKNLHTMDPNMPMTPRTSSSSKSQSITSTSTPRDNGSRMNLVGILDCDQGNAQYKRRPRLQEAVQQIIGTSRASAMKPESAQKFTDTLERLQTRNEATVAVRLMPFLVKQERTVVDELDSSILTSAAGARETIQAFELDGLDWSVDKDFAPDSVPFPTSERAPPSKFGIKNPKPDITYGFDPRAFDSEQRKALLDLEPQISTGIESPFLVVQWKGFQGSIQKAKEQARRDGAAMVWARRKAIARLGISAINKDEDEEEMMTASMAFSCVVNTEVAHIHVHWAEPNKDTTDATDPDWHIAVVARYHMDENEVRNLRRDLHNILDWGLSERLQLVKSHAEIYRSMDVICDANERGGKRRRVK